MKGKIVHWSGRMESAFIARIALALNDQHGSICSGEGAQIVKPIGKRSVPQSKAAFVVSFPLLQLRRPEDEKDGMCMKEKGVRAVIDILAAEVPQVEAHRFGEALRVKRRFTKLDPVGSRDAWIEFQVAQPTAKLRLAGAAVAEEENLQRRVPASAVSEISVVGADFIQNVFVG